MNPQEGAGKPQVALPGAVSLDAAREWLRDRIDEGAECPCCTQFAKVYRRKLAAQTGRMLIGMFRGYGLDWCSIPQLGRDLQLPGRGGDETKARYWGLIEEMDAVRADGSSRVGWWRLTADGAHFVRGGLLVPKYARVYDGRCLGLVGDLVSIRDVLGTRFNYAELMAGV